LTERIRAEIASRGGWIDFEHYMRLALYEPGLGYYSAGSAKLGPHGDFITAPAIGDFLAHALTHTLCRQFDGGLAPLILELGAGTGELAAQLLDCFDALGAARIEYLILEPSAELRERQRARLRRFGERITWLDRLPAEPLSGAIVANEVLDALPVARFVKRAGLVRPLGVSWQRDALVWREGGERAELTAAVERLERELGAPFADGYRSEICLLLQGWVERWSSLLTSGSLLLVDYGLVRREYYHPERSDGTLICHYRHRAHADPFLYPGLQDISAWVDFSACADAAAAAGLTIAGFTTQAQFLLETLAAKPVAHLLAGRSPRELDAFKTLVLPGQMGERFKVLLLTKDIGPAALPGRDFRKWL
jgi:SAM-dependent MidA family methyltransferase